MNETGYVVLDSATKALGPDGHITTVAPGRYPYTVMDGDENSDILTLGDPDNSDVLIARMPRSWAGRQRCVEQQDAGLATTRHENPALDAMLTDYERRVADEAAKDAAFPDETGTGR